MLLAQISDMHILAEGRLLFGRIDTAAHLAAAVAFLNALRPRPDRVLATGDLAEDGSPAAYANLRRLLAPLAIPYALIPGNHDDRASLRAAFPEAPGMAGDGPFLQFALEDGPLRILALDTVEPGEAGGRLCGARLDWLAARLAERPAAPTLIAMHHPPVLTGLAGMDGINCAGAAALGALVARHPQVERIVCGHVHRPICLRWHGTVVTTAPGTAHQVALDLDPAAPVAWTLEPPALHLHYWQGEAGLATHLAPIGAHRPTPYR